MADLSYEDYKQRISIQQLLIDAGYVQNKRDGLRYPSFVMLDRDGRRIRGNKFIVTQNGNCCFQPPAQKSYNIISFIKEHPDLFIDYSPGMNLDHLVNKVCSRLLNTPYEEKVKDIKSEDQSLKPFNINDYSIRSFDGRDRDSQKMFYPYFKHRGIDLTTQYAFRHHILLASKKNASQSGTYYRNLSFPLVIPGKDGITVGFEERGRMRKDGESAYKGKAAGSNGSEGLWIASPNDTKLGDARHVYLFESAYDAMAYFQLKHREVKGLRDDVFVSTGGTPTLKQMDGVINHAPKATFHLCFDNDVAGKQFVANFEGLVKTLKPDSEAAKKFLNTPGNVEIDDDKAEAFSKLPEAVKEQYFSAFRLSEEYATAYLNPEDKQTLGDERDKAYTTFYKMVDDCIVKVTKEIPIDGYKDWNEQLLNESKSLKKPVGSDIDGDGSIEIEESNEEKRHYRR